MFVKHSAIFETMLTPPRANAKETYEGVPLVQLPDGAEKIESLLRVLYHEWYCCPFWPGCERLSKFTRVLPVKRLDPNTPYHT